MEMKQHLSVSLKQNLVMTLRLQQSLKLLQVATLELEQIIRQELTTNPVLEEVEENVASRQETTEEETVPKPKERNEVDWAEYWPDREEYSLPRSYESTSEEFYERAAVITRLSLRELLAGQARITFVSQEDLEIAEEILGSLDERGYFVLYEPDDGGTNMRKVEDPVTNVAARLEKPTEKVLEILLKIQEFEPAGVGARDLRECLLIQLKAKGLENSLSYRVVMDCFELLRARKHSEISRVLKEPPDKVQEAGDIIASLDPKPGLSISGEETRYVVPDLIVEKIDDKYVVFLNDRNVPRLRISASYRELLNKDKNQDSETKKFIQGKLSSARWFIQTIEQRRRTMVGVMKTIVEAQKDFFEKGPEFLKPLTLQEIAEKVEIPHGPDGEMRPVHESTVSRVTSGKYVQTPRGVFELKSFFSSRLETEDGEGASGKGTRGTILQLIEEEDKKNPLSDHEIALSLRQKGLRIARRTVAKYRELLGILPARYRKRI